MKLSTTTLDLEKIFGIKQTIKIIADAGFDCFDYSLHDKTEGPIYEEGYKDYIKDIKDYADSLGIRCNQSHAPYPTQKHGDEEYNQKMLPKIIRSMECAALLGAKTIVVHPVHHGITESDNEYEINKEFYSKLIPYCEKFNIKVATENMWHKDPKRGLIVADVCGNCERFVKMIDYIDSPWITACLDLGHTVLGWTEPDELIKSLGKRLEALHVHDNDYLHDSHTLPCMGKLDWSKITRALAEVGYSGDFTYEADAFMNKFPHDFLPETEKFMCKVGRHLIGMIENII